MNSRSHMPGYFSEDNLFKVNWLTLGNNRFSGTDDEAALARNLIRQPDTWHYRTKKIEYKVNSLGYRTKEFADIYWKESIVIIGCSMVAGVGVAEDETISHYLEKLSGRPVINLGVPAAGIDFALYNNFLLKKNYPTPWAVVNVFSNINRLVTFNETHMEFKGLWSESDDYWKGHMKTIHNSLIKGILDSQQIQYMWKDAKSFNASWFDDTVQYCEVDKLYFTNTARDLMHCGAESNNHNAEIIYSKLKNSIC